MSNFDKMAADLRAAYTGKTIPPLRPDLAANDVDGAYAVQQLNTAYWEKQGRKIVGRKIGLTSPAVQKQLGVDQPDFGVLFDDMQIKNGSEISANRLIQPKAEAEVAIILGEDITYEDCTVEQVAAAVEYACCSIEIVDSRIADWKIKFADTVADNGSSALFILGDEKHSLKNLDLYSCGMVMEVDGNIGSIGTGAACLGHPLNAAAWLAQTLVKRGQSLKAGDILLTGALGPMVTLQPGNDIKAHIGGLGTCSFSYKGT